MPRQRAPSNASTVSSKSGAEDQVRIPLLPLPYPSEMEGMEWSADYILLYAAVIGAGEYVRLFSKDNTTGTERLREELFTASLCSWGMYCNPPPYLLFILPLPLLLLC